MKASFRKYTLEFKRPSGTSRGVLLTKDTYFLEIESNGKIGTGECALFKGLSYDDVPDYEEKLNWLCQNISSDQNFLKEQLLHYPSIWFGLEQAFLNLKYGENLYFPSDFTDKKEAITINGLIWMGDADYMKTQIQEKLDLGFHCIKLKIGVDWNEEFKILQQLRQKFHASQLELRVDANGGFNTENVQKVLQQLSDLEIHSIEQPIKKSEVGSRKLEERWSKMAQLCLQTPIPIALDEELIGIVDFEEKQLLIETIKPQYIILKPALVGGFSGCDEWIEIAEKNNIGWWITSALESNIGLNAIAQYTFTKNSPMPQGLGTGALFTNNFESNLELKGDQLWIK